MQAAARFAASVPLATAFPDLTLVPPALRTPFSYLAVIQGALYDHSTSQLVMRILPSCKSGAAVHAVTV